MRFSNDNYEKAFPREEKKQPKRVVKDESVIEGSKENQVEDEENRVEDEEGGE